MEVNILHSVSGMGLAHLSFSLRMKQQKVEHRPERSRTTSPLDRTPFGTNQSRVILKPEEGRQEEEQCITHASLKGEARGL